MKQLVIAYHTAQAPFVKELEMQLSKVSYHIVHLSPQHFSQQSSLGQELAKTKGPVLLVVSDNLLKDSACMDGLFAAADGLYKEERLLPIVVDGVDEKGLKVPTQFDKVSQVIQYLNYWQDRYLALRREKRQITAGDHAQMESLQAEINRVKQIATEVGEFLRFLKAITTPTEQELRHNHYELLFKWLDDPTGHAALVDQREKSKNTPPPITETQSPTLKEHENAQTAATPPTAPPAQDAPPKAILSSTTDEPSTLQQPSEIQAPSPEEVEKNTSSPPHTEEDLDIEIIRIQPNEETPNTSSAPPLPTQDELEQLFEIDDEEETDSSSLLSPQERNPATPPTPQSSATSHSPGLTDSSSTQRELAQKIADQSLQLVKKGDRAEAVRLFEATIAQHPHNAFLRYEFAFFLAKHVHELARATQELEAIRQLDPQFEDAWFLLGELAETHGDYHLARNYYEKVLELDPDYPGLHYHIGMLLFAHFLPEEAETAARHLKKSLKQYKKNADAHYRLALLYDEYLDKPQKAVKHYKKTLKYQPNHPLAAYDLAVLYHRQEAWELARHYYQMACTLNPEVKTPENDLAFGLTQAPHTSPSWSESASPSGQEAPLPPSEEPPDKTTHSVSHAQQTQTSKFHSIQPTGKKTRPIALVTGATSGIGQATATRLAKAGYDLIVTGRRKERLDALSAQWRQQWKVRVLPLCFDIRQRQQVEQFLGQLPPEWEEVDVLINNAGLARGLAPIHEGDPDDWDTMIDTNIKGLLYVTRQIAPGMVARKKGHIVNVASTAGKEVYPKGNVYCATKHAVDALTKAMRLDLYPYRIRVSQVAPAHVEETEFALVRFKGDAQRAKIYEDFQPLKARDVANAIYYIISQPPHVNVQDVLILGTQQANSIFIDRSGRDWCKEEE